MGYETSLQLVNVKIKNEAIPIVTKAITTDKGRGLAKFRYFFTVIGLDSSGFLRLLNNEICTTPYGINEKDGTALALNGKWYDVEHFASWLKMHAEKGGRIVLHSAEGDGLAWGWEFDGRGGMQYFQLDHIGKWR